jgi:subtilisin-like proprotein convertase family protein
MLKRGITDHSNGGFFDALYGTDDSTLDWNLVATASHGAAEIRPLDRGLDLMSGTDSHPGVGSIPALDDVSDGGSAGPEAAAAGGKKGTGGGGGTTSGGGTTGGGGGTTGGGTTGGGGTTSTPSDIYPTIPIAWRMLNPPTGDSTPPTDTYFSQQWNLTSTTGGINVVRAWQNYTGAGVKIGIIDDGFDYNHPDLNPHYLFSLDYDATNGGSDAYGTSTDAHGTTVAGVIDGARNGSGIVGVAYNAGIAGFRMSFGAGGGPGQINDTFNHALANGMDIVNASWGYATAYQDNFYSSSFAASKTVIQNDIVKGRGGLGLNVVFSAGNGHLTGDNVNYHNYQNDPYVITVAGTGPNGHINADSTPGAAILVSAPGASIKTDDRLGADGYSSGDIVTMAGTSFAAPAVAGVIALMLQANPDLGYRDVMEILAYSAKNSDPTNTGWQTNGAHDWNGGGLHFSNDYGFGLVDATAAVRLAESWQKQSTYADMSVQTVSHTDNAKIPDGTGSLQSTITLGSSERIDKMVVDFDITHPHVGDLTVTLTSPSGTTAILAAHPASGTGSGVVFETTANNFWGEDAKGDWTLTVTDSVSGNVGTLNSWTLQSLGDAPNTPTTYIYTDEFATAAGANRLVLNGSSGNATINTAAVTTGSYLDLHAGALDTIAGKSLQIGTSTVIKNVWAGDGNDIIIANDFGDTIQGGRGNDTILAGHGADVLYGGPGSDTFVFNFLATALHVIGDFTAGQDLIDLHQLLTSIGYAGSNPVADNWIDLVTDGKGGTDVAVDPHNGQAAVMIADVLGVAPTVLHNGTSFGMLMA